MTASARYRESHMWAIENPTWLVIANRSLSGENAHAIQAWSKARYIRCAGEKGAEVSGKPYNSGANSVWRTAPASPLGPLARFIREAHSEIRKTHWSAFYQHKITQGRELTVFIRAHGIVTDDIHGVWMARFNCGIWGQSQRPRADDEFPTWKVLLFLLSDEKCCCGRDIRLVFVLFRALQYKSRLQARQVHASVLGSEDRAFPEPSRIRCCKDS